MAQNTGKFVCYYRVSTGRQGRSGLGLEAQKQAVTDHLNGGDWRIVAEFTEVESGKREDNRPMLDAAFKACRVHRAVLVIAKLDRLSRDAHFLLGLQKAGVKFVAADMPEANDMVVGIIAVIAEGDREMISARTKAALEGAKACGVNLGGFRGVHFSADARKAGPEAQKAIAKARAADLRPIIAEIQAAGITSLGKIAAELTARQVLAARRGAWSPMQVSRVLLDREDKS